MNNVTEFDNYRCLSEDHNDLSNSEMNKKLVSVLVACYNGEQYIDLCFDALLKQTHQNFEIIVCDDNSSDNSLAKLRSWEKKDNRICVIHNETSLKASGARNRCLEKAKGEYIAIQDIDDYSAPNRIMEQLKVLQNGRVDFVASSAYEFSDARNDGQRIIKPFVQKPTKWSFLKGQPFLHPTTMFTAKCLKDVGGYRVAEETQRAEDYDLYMRLYSKGYVGINLSEPLYYYRLDEGNYKRRTFAGRRGEIKVRKQGFKALGLMPLGYIFAYKPVLSHILMHIKLLFHKL